MDADLDYLRVCIESAGVLPFPWDGEDKNLLAFRSKEELAAWYCQPPGVVGEPYRDRGFYTRELAMLSRVVQPKSIVEFGTSLGIGTCLLRWLNPSARLVTVDTEEYTYMPGERRVPIGYLAKWNGILCEYVFGTSCDYIGKNVDLCFIDGDHSYAGVIADSQRAWINRASGGRWVIVWHDHNDRHPGVMRAVEEFCHANGAWLESREDSDTVWIRGGG